MPYTIPVDKTQALSVQLSLTGAVSQDPPPSWQLAWKDDTGARINSASPGGFLTAVTIPAGDMANAYMLEVTCTPGGATAGLSMVIDLSTANSPNNPLTVPVNGTTTVNINFQ